jgi:hypothetical protein
MGPKRFCRCRLPSLEELLYDSRAGKFHQFSCPFSDSPTAHEMNTSAILLSPQVEGFQATRSLTEAKVVLAVQTSTGVSLSVPSEAEAHFVVTEEDEKSDEIFDFFLGRMRKRLMIDEDSKREKNLAIRWKSFPLEQLQKNSLYQDGDEDLDWEDFMTEIHRR